MLESVLNYLANGLTDWSAWGIVGFTLVVTHITIAAVTIYLHRHQAHRALDLHPLPAHFFRFWLWLTTGMTTKAWVAIHRKHHAKCETADDPHSPQVKGINKVLWQGAELYRAEAANGETLEKFGHGTPDDWIERNLYSRYHSRGIVIMLLIDLALFGAVGLTVWAVQMLWIPLLAAGIINGLGHFWGYRNYECPDASTNISPWGILIGGEELHNNHHTFASSAKLSNQWWEFDIGWLYIRLLETVGLAKVRKVAPKPVIDPAKSALDTETVKAVFTNRFQVMARYAKDVITPVRDQELRQVRDAQHRSLLKRAKALLAREESLMDEGARKRLEKVLETSNKLETVYRFKVNLQQIWKRSAATQEHLVHALQDWCHQAEQTGIKALQDFARHLRAYSMPATA